MKWLALFLMGCASTCPCGVSRPHLTLNLPEGWSCHADGSATACREGSRKDDVVIWTMKETGSGDTMETFRRHLGTPISHGTFVSTPRSLRTVTINGVDWLDAVQSQSEIKGYETRYLATVDGGLSVLVTFSSVSSSFASFSARMQPVIDQLVVRR